MRMIFKCDFCGQEKYAVVNVSEYSLCYSCERGLESAAPELLEALENVLEDYETIARTTGHKPEDFEIICNARGQMVKVAGVVPSKSPSSSTKVDGSLCTSILLPVK